MMAPRAGRRKLIEVAVPLKAINEEAAREKTIRHGHPSTFHLWFARRPLAACRAVLFASLIDDPSEHPKRFPTEVAQQQERERLFRLIERLVPWEASNDAVVLAEAAAEIRRSCGDTPPAVLDPFCGGGSIPLEAQRLGLEALGGDLNPVPVLITRALVEIPPKFSGRPPVRPPTKDDLDLASWSGAQGLAADVRHYGRWMRDRARDRIGHLYPEVTDPASGARARVLAWLWARTVPCPNPACGKPMPLLNGFAVSRKKGREVWLDPTHDPLNGEVRFRVRRGPGCPTGGSVNRNGATCLTCGAAVPLAEVRRRACDGDMRAQLLCTVAEGTRERLFFEASEAQIAASLVDRPEDVPTTELARNPRAITTPNYGITQHWQLFTNRQLVAMTTFTDLVSEAREQLLADGAEPEYADAVTTYLGLCVSRLANRCSRQNIWNPLGEKVEQVFARNALPMIWVHAEANPFSDSSGNFVGQVDYLCNALSAVPARGAARIVQLDAAASVGNAQQVMVCTDPPYYDNVPYADLSDFFYVWLRRSLGSIYSDLFSTILVPKAQELIAEPARQGSWERASDFFEAGLRHAFAAMLDVQDPAYPMTVFYAFRQAEDSGDGAGHASTGWETMLQGLLDAGASITGTLPIRTERSGGLRDLGRAALASSIVLVCRKRDAAAPMATRREFLDVLRADLPVALHRLQLANIAPVDLAQASIGPGMAAFSQFSRVMEADGSAMAVRTALGLINQVLDEVLSHQEGDLDAETRWAVAWFEESGMEPGSFGRAETLSKAKNTAVNALVQAGIVEARAQSVRLRGAVELAGAADPFSGYRVTVWQVTQHLVAALETGEQAAAALLARLGQGMGERARDLAYRLYVICERRRWSADALRYNGLVVAWPEIVRLASATAGAPTQQRMEV